MEFKRGGNSGRQFPVEEESRGRRRICQGGPTCQLGRKEKKKKEGERGGCGLRPAGLVLGPGHGPVWAGALLFSFFLSCFFSYFSVL
jgi:hypothetical protein